MSGFSPLLTRAVVAAVLVGIALPATAQEVRLRSKEPCHSAQGFCTQFTASTPPPDQLQRITLSAPASGTVLVAFNASGLCGNDAVSQVRVADFVTQIVNTEDAVPDANGAGAVRVGMAILGTAFDQPSPSVPFNLSSTRNFPVTTAGNKVYRVKITLLRLDAAMTCTIHGGNMSVLFVPN